MNLLLRTCKAVLQVTDEEIEQIRRDAQAQMDYTHPLKMATVTRVRATGEYNMRALNAFVELRNVLKTGAKIREPK